MIARLVAFGLHQRFVTVALALLLTAGGVLSWTRLPIEAYPDVGDVTVEVITLWPGHAAEEVERLITIQLEKELNGSVEVRDGVTPEDRVVAAGSILLKKAAQ